jgi:hypothetical protein
MYNISADIGVVQPERAIIKIASNGITIDLGPAPVMLREGADILCHAVALLHQLERTTIRKASV